MSAVSSELTIAELEGQVGELLPAREEMATVTFRRRVSFFNIGNRSGNTFGNEAVNFSGKLSITDIRYTG